MSDYDKVKQTFLEITSYDEYDLRREEFRSQLAGDREAEKHLQNVILYIPPELQPEYEEGIHIDYFYRDARELDVDILKKEAVEKLAFMRNQGDIYSEPHKTKYLEAVRRYIDQINKIRNTGEAEIISTFEYEKRKEKLGLK